MAKGEMKSKPKVIRPADIHNALAVLDADPALQNVMNVVQMARKEGMIKELNIYLQYFVARMMIASEEQTVEE